MTKAAITTVITSPATIVRRVEAEAAAA